MNTLDCIRVRIDYLTTSLTDVTDIECKTAFEIQLAEYLWDEMNKALMIKDQLEQVE
jgi:hypothetical protein